MISRRRIAVVVLVALGGSSCWHDRPLQLPETAWQPALDLQGGLPESVQVFELAGSDPELCAWYVRVDPRRPDVDVRVVVAEDTDGVETVSEFAARTGATVAINGSFFGTGSGIGKPDGLVLTSGRRTKPPWRVFERDGVTYPLARSTLGIAQDGSADIAWVTRADEGEPGSMSLVEWPAPWNNRPGAPCTPPDPSLATSWQAHEAVQGGPNLLHEGRIWITAEEEVTNERLLERHPRSAAGITADGALILMVVDGRRWGSRGADFPELAQLMLSAGCVEALNLDGGGSSALVVGGRLVNVPGGSGIEREVANAIVVLCEPTAPK